MKMFSGHTPNSADVKRKRLTLSMDRRCSNRVRNRKLESVGVCDILHRLGRLVHSGSMESKLIIECSFSSSLMGVKSVLKDGV